MRPLFLDELDREREAFDAAAAATPDIDGFCSSSEWTVPAHHAFMPNRRARLFAGAEGYLALMEDAPREGVRIWMPLEMVWALGCPMVGARPDRLAAEVISFLDGCDEWDVIVVSGVAAGSDLARHLFPKLAERHLLSLVAEPTRRSFIDLQPGADGLEHYLARRSRNFRKSVTRATAAVAAAGITFETITPDEGTAPAAFARLLAVEARSWKGRDGDGLAAPEMQAFYREMLARLARRNGAVLTFARAPGGNGAVDVGYILGAMFSGTYRGLQFSYDEAHAALGVGNALQCHTIQQMALRGATLYDLGAEVDYKARWRDRTFETVTVAVRR